MVLPGTYSVTLAKEVDGEITPLADAQQFDVVPLELATFAAEDRAEVMAFQKKLARLQRAVRGAIRVAHEARNRINHVRKAILDTPGADHAWLTDARELEERLNELLTRLRGDRTRSKRQEALAPSINRRVQQVVGNQWHVTSPPTQTQRDAYSHAGSEFSEVLAEMRQLVETDLKRLEARLEKAGAPWTPGRIPVWEME
jgi:hypothetical protein